MSRRSAKRRASTNVATAPRMQMQEAWGDPVDRREFMTDDPSFYGAKRGIPFTTINDRADGKFYPVYENEQDLAYIRGQARLLAGIAASAIGAQTSLCNYVIGPGFDFKLQTEDKQTAPPELIAEGQAIIDRFLDDNGFIGDLDREAHNRSRDDGETLLNLIDRGNGHIKAQVVEPDQLRAPADPTGLYEWMAEEFGIDCDGFVPSWSFGVLTEAGHTDEPIGYHIVRDSAGCDWDFVPVKRMEHFRRNVTRNAKRGVSDFYPIMGEIDREAKLRKNTAEGAALQAAIAWICEEAQGTTQAQSAGVLAANASNVRQRTTATGTQPVQQRKYESGSVINVSSGRKYLPGPMGSERCPNFILVAQYVLRMIGVRWQMPEALISGDASNANLASSLVAEAPFVKARQADQQYYTQRFDSLLWKVLRMAHEMGLWGQSYAFAQIKRTLAIKTTPPEVATRNPLEMAQVQQLKMGMGILSKSSAAAEWGDDLDEEAKAGAVPVDGATVDPLAIEAPAADTNVAATAMNGAQVASLVDLVAQIASGTLPKDSAKAIMGAAFPLLTPIQLASIVDPVQPGTLGPDGKPIAAQVNADGTPAAQPSGAYLGLKRSEWNNARKGIADVLADMASGKSTEATARVYLGSLGMGPADIDTLLKDASDGTVDTKLPDEVTESKAAAIQGALESVSTTEEARAILEQMYP